MVRYPHTLTIIPIGTATKDENGDFVEATPTDDTVTYRCRVESSDSNGILKGIDGSLINYSWIVYMPLFNVIIAEGSLVSIDMNGLQINDNVKRFSPGQFNIRLWL